jgi:hypothetical protein
VTPQEKLLAEAVRRGLIKPGQPQATTTAPAQQSGTPEGYERRLDENNRVYYQKIGSEQPAAQPGSDDGPYAQIGGFRPSIVGMLKGAWDAAKLPGDVWAGKTQVMTPSGAFNPDTLSRGMNLAGMATPLPTAVRAGEGVIPGAPRFMRTTPTAEQMAKIGNKQFENLRQMPIDYSPVALKNWSIATEQKLNDRGFSDVTDPEVVATLRKLQKLPKGVVSVTPNNIIALRQSLQHIAENPDKRAAAKSAISALDEFISAAPGQGAVSGPGGAFAAAYDTARQNRAAAFRSDELGTKQAVAEWRASSANSGKNLGNTLRQRATDLLAQDKKSGGTVLQGWSQGERDALEAIVKGTASKNAVREISNRLAGGGGVGSSVLMGGAGAAGYALGGPVGAAIGTSLPLMAGAGTRKLYNNMMTKAVDRLEEMLLQRTPEFQGRKGVVVPDNPRELMTLLRAALLTQPPQKPVTADQFYLSAKQQREARQAANEKMRRGLQ